MFLAFANMDIYDKFTPAMLRDKWSHIAAAQLVIADTNLPSDTLEELIRQCQEEDIPVSSILFLGEGEKSFRPGKKM